MSVDAAAAPGRIKRLLTGLVAGKDEQEAREVLARAEAVADAEPISVCHQGDMATVCGTLKSIRMRPANEMPAFEAELFDGSGHITLVWLGRRQIRGIEPGRSVVATGRVTNDGTGMRMYNPRYALRPSDS